MFKLGNKIETGIANTFYRLGSAVARRPVVTLALSLLLAAVCGVGIKELYSESRSEKLWVPQDTRAEIETALYQSYFPRSSRFNTVIVERRDGGNILTKESLRGVMKVHERLETMETSEGGDSFTDLCTPSGAACSSYDPTLPVCGCLVTSVLRAWNYDADALAADDDVLGTLHRETDPASLGNPVLDDDTGAVVSATALRLSYFLADRSTVLNGRYEDVVNEAWEKEVFLDTLESDDYSDFSFYYLSARSFSDEFGGAISGDLVYVQVSYVLALVFLGATLGRFRCGPGSRWAMALSALFLVGLSTVAGFGISAGLFGLFFGPVHSLLPFILLGIGVDDVFVIVNAFNQERRVARKNEDDAALQKRTARALKRAGASITVTSATDLVAFAISSSSALPALASFCAYASICIFFLWLFAVTFFTATMVQDEKRQRDNRRDCVCCLTRPSRGEGAANDDEEREPETKLSKYFRKYHGPLIFSKSGKMIVLAFFTALLGFGIYGAINLPVEDSERKFIPQDSYVNDFIDASDKYFEDGVSLTITFMNGDTNIYQNRDRLANLRQEFTGLSTAPPYIAEPDSDDNYQNVMEGFYAYLASHNSTTSNSTTTPPLGDDGWPTTYQDFAEALAAYVSPTGPGGRYLTDVSFDATDKTTIRAIKVNLKYVKLLKKNRGKIIDDADKFIEAMDSTRDMIDQEFQDVSVYSDKFIAIEGFKIIKLELFRNVGLAIICVGIIVLVTVASFVTSFLITLNVTFCIIEILGFMYAAGIVIDSVSVINIVLAVGLSVDYSAHVGHCFMSKAGTSRDQRATEALADIGSSVLNGATSTFLAVAVLLFSSSYVFQTLSVQFALTVVLGILHGLVLLPVMLSIVGPPAFASSISSKEEAVDEAVEVVHTEHKNKGGEE